MGWHRERSRSIRWLSWLIAILLAFVTGTAGAALFLLASWICESPSTGQGAGACQAVSVDDIGVGKLRYSSTNDIPIDPQFIFPPNQQPNFKNSFTFEFNQQDVPPFNGITDTTKNEDIEGEIVGGLIETTKITDNDIQLLWDSVYPGKYAPLPADWAAVAPGKSLIGDVELHYDPENSNYVTRLVVSVFSTIPEPSSLLLFVGGVMGLLFALRRNAQG